MPRGNAKTKETKEEVQSKSKTEVKNGVEEKKNLSQLPSHCDKLWKVLGECQRSVSCHNRGLQAVMKLMETLPFEEFMKAFIPGLNRMLVVFKREPAIERLVKFVTLIATNQTTHRYDLRDQFLDSVLGYLVKRCDSKDKAVRFRCCQIIASVLRAMDPDSEIVEDLFQEIESRMLVCARDKLPVIRVQAIYALSRLQTDEGDGDVNDEFQRLLQTDSHKDCRRVVLGEIALSQATVLLVLQRCRDVSAEVRKQAFLIIKAKIQLTAMDLPHRNWVVKQGLQDRDEGVRKACSSLIQQWLLTCENDLIKLLGFFDVEHYTAEAEILATHVLKEIKHETRRPPFEHDLTSEMALYWRVLCNSLGKSEEVDILLPDTVRFCHLLQDCNSPARTFVLRQLLQIALFADLQDEAGRKQLEALYRTLLCSKAIATDLLPCLTQGLRKMYGCDETGFLRGVLEIISEIRDPVTGEEEEAAEGRQELENRFAGLSGDIEQVKSELQMYRELKQTAEVTKLQQRLVALQQEAALVELELSSSVYQDEATWARMLCVVADLLQHLSALRGPAVSNLLATTILPALQLGSESIQDIAIRCLGLYCSLDLAAAKAHLPILLRVLREDDSLTLMHSALRAVLDLTLIFDALEEKEGKVTEENNVVGLVVSFLPKSGQELGEGKDMASCAVEGLSKLLLFNKVRQQECKGLVSRLLVLFFDASSQHLESIRQYLTVFWLVYSQSSSMQPHNTILAEAFVPTLRALAVSHSQAQLNNVSQYMVGMLHTADAKTVEQKRKHDRAKGFELDNKHGDVESAGGSYLQTAATELCHAILCCPDNPLCKAACHALSLMDFSRFLQPSIKTLFALLQQHSLQDKQSLKYMTKILTALQKLDDKVPLSHQEAARIEEAKAAALTAWEREEASRPKSRTRASAPTRAKKAPKKEEWDVSSEEVSEEESEEEEEESEEEESEEEESEKQPRLAQSRRPLVKPLVRSSEDEEELAPVVVRPGRTQVFDKSSESEEEPIVVAKGRRSTKQETKQPPRQEAKQPREEKQAPRRSGTAKRLEEIESSTSQESQTQSDIDESD